MADDDNSGNNPLNNEHLFYCFLFLQTSSTSKQPSMQNLQGKTTISTNFSIQPKFNSSGITYNIVSHSPLTDLTMSFIALSQSTKMLSALSNKTAGCTYSIWYAKGVRISTGCVREDRSQGPWQMYGVYFIQNSTWYMMMVEYSTSPIHTTSYILYHTPWTAAMYIRR